MVTVERWWGQRRRGLPTEVWQAWRQDGRSTRVLAWARTEAGYAVASPATFAWGDAPGFRFLGWQQFERGEWNAETRRLTWTLYPADPSGDGLSARDLGEDSDPSTGRAPARHGSVELLEPGRLPEVFRERVAASVVLEQFVPLRSGDNRGVIVAVRRNPVSRDSTLIWHSTLTRGLTWQTAGVAEFAQREVARLRAEWDSAPSGW